MSFENPMQGNKKETEKSPKKTEDLETTAVLDMPDGFEDKLLQSKEESQADDSVFEIDLDDLSNSPNTSDQKSDLYRSRERVSALLGAELDAPPAGLSESEMTSTVPHEEKESTIRLEGSNGVQEIEFDFGQSEVTNQEEEVEEDFENNEPGEIAQEYKKLNSEQIEQLKNALREELISFVETAKSPTEVIEKQNAFILEHASKLGFPENLAQRLIADGRRILPIAPLATQGAMSAVFKSLNLNNDGQVLFGKSKESEFEPTTDVLKVIYRAGASKSLLERFKQEAIAGANLNLTEKRVVGVRDADFEIPEAGYFMVLEEAEGNDLKQEIEDQKLSPEKTISYVTDIAKALKSVHEAGIIHRDIKPANIFVHRETLKQGGNEEVKESIKLADLGLIKVGGEMKNREGEIAVKDLSISKPGLIVGTPLYQAPEVFLDNEETKETDIYSLGITMYELLTKKYPYIESSSYTELVSSATEGKIVELTELAKEPEYADIPFDLAQLIDEMIEVDPSARPSIDEIIERLEQLKNSDQEVIDIPKREASQGRRIQTIKEEGVQEKPKGILKSLFSRKK